MHRTTLAAAAALLGVAAAASAVAPPAAAQPPSSRAGAPAKPGPIRSAVRDDAKMFTPAEARACEAVLRDVEARSGWQTRVDTVDSLAGRDPRDAAVAGARKAEVSGLYVLLAKKERQIRLEPSRSAEKVFTKEAEDRVLKAFKAGMGAPAGSAGGPTPADRALRLATAEVRRSALGYGVRDGAGMFSADAVGLADHRLAKVLAGSGRQVVVETVPTLDSRDPAKAAAERAEALGLRGVYVLIVKEGRKLYVEPTSSAKSAFPRDRTRKVVDGLVAAFKSGKFDDGLAAAVGEIGRDAGLTAADAKPGPWTPTPDDSNRNTVLNVAQATPRPSSPAPKPVGSAIPNPPAPPTPPTPPSVPSTAAVPRLPGPGDPPSTPATPAPVASIPAPSPKMPPSPAPEPEKPQARQGSIAPIVIVALLILGGLWAISRLFRRRPEYPPQPNYGPQQAGYGPPPGQGVPPNQGARPGYGPQGPRPAPGYGPQPAYNPPPGPGYGPPPPGYGYGYGGAPPAGGGGGGFVSGALGGLGGAILGNILYDRLGRPHHVEPGVTHLPAEVYEGRVPYHPPAGMEHAVPPETYDPNAGAGGDWGTPDAQPAGAGGDWGSPDANTGAVAGGAGGDWGLPDQSAPTEPVGGDWGASAPAEEAVGGDWGSADPTPDQGGDWGDASPADDGGGGDWGSPDASPDDGGGGEWGGGDVGGGTDDDNQGGW